MYQSNTPWDQSWSRPRQHIRKNYSGFAMKESSHLFRSTEWTNSIVPVRKANGSLRLCLDLKDLNKNIQGNQYYTRTIDDLSAELHGTKYFTLMDAKSGYWMIWLDRESSLLMTFNKLWGKYRWLWLPFGLLVSSDIFQERLDAVIKTVPGVTGIADDVLAKGDDETSHDVPVLSLLKTAWSNNLKFSPDKVQFKTIECKFFGQLLTQVGMSINLKKVSPIRKMDALHSKKELESYQGMVNYLKWYSSRLMLLAEPLKVLLRNDTWWCWECKHQEAFKAIKEELKKA